MRTLVIGDIHGKQIWKKALDTIPNIDKIVFLGDYVDSYDVTRHDISENLKDIIAFKSNNLDKVSLLLGNHDLQYYFLYDKTIKCSGYSNLYASQYSDFFINNWEMFSLIDTLESDENCYIFNHAGISKKWLETHIDSLLTYREDNSIEKTSEIFDYFLQKQSRNFLWDVSLYRGGLSNVSSFVWTDRQEIKSNVQNYDIIPVFPKLFNNMNKKTVQVVGHSRVNSILTINNMIYFTDCLDERPQFLIIDTNSNTQDVVSCYDVITSKEVTIAE
jgi:hypothetical protein